MKRSLRVLGVVVVISLVFGTGYLAGTTRQTTPALAQGGGTGSRSAATEKLFAPFWQAWDIVQQRYVDIAQVDQNKLMEGALAGMVDALGDPHSGYMDPKLFDALLDNMHGEFDGIGATVRKDETTGGLLIVATLPDSPARSALKAGDIIVRVDDEDITKLPQMQIISKVRGPAGTEVKLGILRKGETKIVQIIIKRARIKTETVSTALYDGEIGYIRLAEFNENASAEFAAGLRSLNADNLNGLVFDLRNDPGGGLQTAIEIASQFLNSGTIVIQRGRPGTREIKYESTGRSLVPTVPLVVLVNEASASASELVAGALQDRGRAKVIGVRSFGKGSVQSWVPLNNGGGLRITIAHFFAPSGRVVNEVGVLPDIIVPWNYETSPDNDPQLAEAIFMLRGQF